MREKDPEFDLKIAYLATVLKWDFSAFERQSTTKSTRKLADAIKSTKKTGSRPSRGTSNNVDFDTMRKSLRQELFIYKQQVIIKLINNGKQDQFITNVRS